MDFMDRQNLVIANALESCKGMITRERMFENKTEKSVIDYIMVCEELSRFILETKIDEDRIDVLSRYVKTKQGRKIITSDHNILHSKFSIMVNRKPRSIRKEMFLFKCEESRKSFLEETSSTSRFSSCFSENEDFQKSSKSFFKALDRAFHKCFKKVRIRTGNSRLLGEESIQEKMRLKSELKTFLLNNKCKVAHQIATTKLDEIEQYIVEETASKNTKVVKDHLERLETLEGTFSNLGFWKLKQKLCPLAEDPPMAKKDHLGNIITSPEAIKKLYIDTYKNRLRNRIMKPELMDLYFLKTEI